MQKRLIIKDLDQALRAAKMEHASFANIGGSTLQQMSADGKRVLREPVEETEYIREQTRLYRESWIIPFIEAAIARIEAGK